MSHRGAKRLAAGLLFLVSSIDAFAVADLDDVDHQYRNLDGIENAVTSVPDSITFEARQFQCTPRSRVVSERLNALDDAPSIGFRGERFEFFAS